MLLIGIYVVDGKNEKLSNIYKSKNILRFFLVKLGIEKYKDHHMIHPTLSNLKKIIIDNKFYIKDIYWQPYWNNKVCYILASKNSE